jgi:hypothetical protein
VVTDPIQRKERSIKYKFPKYLLLAKRKVRHISEDSETNCNVEMNVVQFLFTKEQSIFMQQRTWCRKQILFYISLIQIRKVVPVLN